MKDFMDLDQLLQNCKSEIKEHLLRALYPNLNPGFREIYVPNMLYINPIPHMSPLWGLEV